MERRLLEIILDKNPGIYTEDDIRYITIGKLVADCRRFKSTDGRFQKIFDDLKEIAKQQPEIPAATLVNDEVDFLVYYVRSKTDTCPLKHFPLHNKKVIEIAIVVGMAEELGIKLSTKKEEPAPPPPPKENTSSGLGRMLRLMMLMDVLNSAGGEEGEEEEKGKTQEAGVNDGSGEEEEAA